MGEDSVECICDVSERVSDEGRTLAHTRRPLGLDRSLTPAIRATADP
jgi:hypothetical protein